MGYATLRVKEVLKNELVLFVAVVTVPLGSVTVHVKAYAVKVVALVTVRDSVTPLALLSWILPGDFESA